MIAQSPILAGMAIGFFSWLGFTMTTIANNALYLKKPFALVAIDAGHYLVTFVVSGAIIGALL
jgi:hypothetical protein